MLLPTPVPDKLHAFSWGFIFVAVGFVLLCVCGVCQSNSIVVGPLAVVGTFFLGSNRFRLMLVFVSVRRVSLFLPRALSTVQMLPLPASLISLFGLFY